MQFSIFIELFVENFFFFLDGEQIAHFGVVGSAVLDVNVVLRSTTLLIAFSADVLDRIIVADNSNDWEFALIFSDSIFCFLNSFPVMKGIFIDFLLLEHH